MYIVARLMMTFDKLENMEAPGPIKLHHSIEIRSGTGVHVRLHAATPLVDEKRAQSGRKTSFDLGPQRSEVVA
jgi:hypothetical protein